MGILTNIFYLVSTSLMIPVMLVLLVCLVRVMFLAGRMLREYTQRASVRPELEKLAESLERGVLSLPTPSQSTIASRAITRLWQSAGNEVLADKIVHDCQLAWQSDLEQLRSIARLGPALGLMGTLIPLGPALVGLAAGDLQMMSQNLIIAFATTVVGLLAGTLATLLAGTKKRWYQSDQVLVVFVAHRLPQLRKYPASYHQSPVVSRGLSDPESDSAPALSTSESMCAQETSHA